MYTSQGTLPRRWYAEFRRRRLQRKIYAALNELDSRTLRDLGFDRSQLTSVAAEISGAAELTRTRLLQATHRLPH